MGKPESKFSLNTGQVIMMKEFCDDLNKALPGITGHFQGWQLMIRGSVQITTTG